MHKKTIKSIYYGAILLVFSASNNTLAINLVNEDQVVVGKQCIGAHCVTDDVPTTLTMSDTNIVVKFDDTSTIGGYPSNDWHILINSSLNGGDSFFAISDADASTLPFMIAAEAPDDSLYISQKGHVGIGTDNPIGNLQISNLFSASLFLDATEINGDSNPWSLSAAPNGFYFNSPHNNTSIVIEADAPTGSLYLTDDGLGINNIGPLATTHISKNADSAATETLRIENRNGDSRITLHNSDDHYEWEIGTDSRLNANFFSVINAADRNIGMALFSDGSFQVGSYDDGIAELRLSSSGDMILQGTLTETSSKTTKENFQPVDVNEVLQRVNQLDITRWNYIKDQNQSAHLGPMAEDFYAAFGLGLNEKHISTVDKDGVALASIQALSHQAKQKDQEIEKLKQAMKELQSEKNQQIDTLQRQLESLSAHVNKLNALITP